MQVVKILNRTSGAIVGDRVEVADTSLTRLWGLLGRPGLTKGGGLWIKPSSGVHTFGMKFTIDVIGLDKELTIVKLWPNLQPFRITSVSLRIISVVELAAGKIQECGLAVGDQIEMFPSKTDPV